MNWTNYFAFLTWLNGLGDKLPQAAQLLQVIINAAAQLGALFGQKPQMMSESGSTSPDESRLESEVVSKLNAKGAIPLPVDAGVQGAHAMKSAGAFDGSLLRQIYAFIQAHPELVTFLLSFLKLS